MDYGIGIGNGTWVVNATAPEAPPILREAGPSTGELLRELDHRRNGPIDIWLLWRQRDDLVFVEVADGRTGDRFTVEVAEDERPFDVFHHPYAYAALHRIDAHDGADA